MARKTKKREKSEADLKRSISRKIRRIRDIDRLSKLDELEATFAQESIYGQLQKELERLEELKSEIVRKQQLAQQNQENHAAYERNKIEINRKIHQHIQVSQERESTLERLRMVVDQLKTANSEQKAQIDRHRKRLVQDLQERKSICVQLKEEIKELEKAKSKLKEEIRQEGQQLPFEEKEVRPVYVQIQLEIDKLKTEKSKIEAEIGHQIFLLIPKET